MWIAGRRDSTLFGVVDDTTTTKFTGRPYAVHCQSLPVVVDKVVVVVLKFPNSFLPRFHLCSLADEHPGLELEELVHEVDEWEVARDRIKLENMIGSGAFGAVWKATLKQSDKKHGAQTVAAKHFTRESVQHITLDTFIFDVSTTVP